MQTILIYNTDHLWQMARVQSGWKSQTKVKFDAMVSVTAPQASIHVFLITTGQDRES